MTGAIRGHTICLNCGATFGAHDPDDPNGCPEWHPSTMKEQP
jgi:hypothetical protein